MELPYNVELVMRVIGLYLGTFLTTRWSLKQKTKSLMLFLISIVVGLASNFYIFPLK